MDDSCAVNSEPIYDLHASWVIKGSLNAVMLYYYNVDSS